MKPASSTRTTDSVTAQELLCPSDGRLRALLGEDLAPADRAHLEAHLEGCPSCQHRLHHLSRSPEEALLRAEPPEVEELPPDFLGRLTRATAALFEPVAGEAPPPSEIPGYRLLGELGRGGMGVVYLANQIELNRQVALKVILRGQHAGREERARFRREAETVAGLHHPHIVPVYEVGEHQGVVFFSMEYVAGGSLDHRLDGSPWPAAAAACLIEAVALAVQHAHEHGVIHRDLKPGNILLAAVPRNEEGDEQGPVPRVTDFGLAKVMGDTDERTRSGMLLGTPQYVAPEQVSCAEGVVGPPTDVHALGAILYELLTGRPPFQAPEVIETLLQVRFHDPVPPRRLQPGLSRDLDTVVLHCLHKQPQRRYGSAAELARDLRRFLDGKPVLVRPIPPWERLTRTMRRHPWVSSLSALCLFVFLLGFALVVGQWQRAEQQAEAARRANEGEHRARQEAVRLSSAAVLDLGITLCERGDLGPGLAEFSRADRLAEEADSGALQRAARANSAAWGLEWFAPRVALHHPSTLLAVALSPCGRYLATGGEDAARVWDTGTGRAVACWRHERPVRALAFTPDGRYLLTGEGGGGGPRKVLFWDVQANRQEGEAVPLPATVRGLDVSLDGKQFLAVTRLGVWVGALEDRQAQPLPDLRGQAIVAARFVAGGRVAVATRKQVLLYSTQPSGIDVVTLPHPADVELLAVSANGKWLASASADLAIRCWDADGKPLGSPLRHRGPICALVFHPDGRLASCNETALLYPQAERRLRRDVPAELRVWSPEAGEPVSPPFDLPRRATILTFDQTGQLLLAGGDDRVGRVFHLGLKQPVGNPLPCSGPVRWGFFSPNGRWLLLAGKNDPAPPGSVPETVLQLLGVPPRAREGIRSFPRSTPTYRLAFTPAGDALLAGDGPDCQAWDLASGQPRTLPDPGSPPSAEQFRQPGPSARRPVPFRLWDQALGQQLLPGHRIGAGQAVIFSPAGDRALVVEHQRAWLWDVDAGRPLPGALEWPAGYSAAAFRPDGKAVLLVGLDRTAHLVEVSTGRTMARWDFPEMVWAVTFHPTRPLVAVAGPGVSARLWALDPERPFGPLLSHSEAGVLQAAFTPDGLTLVTVGRDRTARLWDVATGRPIGPPLRFADRVTAVAISPDGHWLAAGVENRQVEVRPMPIQAGE